MPTSRRRLSLTVAAGAMALGLAACGSQVATTTTGAGAAAAPAALTGTATPSPGALAGKAVDAKALAMTIATASAAQKYVHIAGSAGGQSVSGSISYVNDTIRTHMLAGADTEAITIGKTMYVKKAGKWTKQAPHGSSPMGMGIGTPDVGNIVAMLGKTVRDLGPTTIAGKSVTHYRSTVTMAEVASAATTSNERQMLDSVAKMGITGATTDLYVGAGNLPVKVTMTVNGAPAGLADSALTYSGWGTPVTITAPKTS
jgi:hypothetical protein